MSSKKNSFPKIIPELTNEQKLIKDDFMEHWLKILRKKYTIVDNFNHKVVLKSIVGNSEVKETDCNLCPRFSIEDCACGGTGIEQELIPASHNHFVRCHPRLLKDN